MTIETIKVKKRKSVCFAECEACGEKFVLRPPIAVAPLPQEQPFVCDDCQRLGQLHLKA